MIKHIFLPESFQGYRIFPQRIIAYDIGKSAVTLVQLYCAGKTVTLEKTISQQIDLSKPLKERLVEALSLAQAQCDRYDAVYTTLPSSLMTFKTLKLPFTNYEKIKMVLNYEMEPLLPYPVSEAVIDCVITHTDLQEKSAEVFVVAAPKNALIEQLGIFKEAGIEPALITVDMLGLYNLVGKGYMPEGSCVTVNLDHQETRLSYIVEGKIKLIRTLGKGYAEYVASFANKTGLDQHHALEYLIRYGFDGSSEASHYSSVKEAFEPFLRELGFTIASFNQQIPSSKGCSILLSGNGAYIKKIDEYFSSVLQHPCSVIDMARVLAHHGISLSPQGALPGPEYAISLGVGTFVLTQDPLNLLPEEIDNTQTTILSKQLFTALILSLTLIIAMVIGTVWQIRSLKSELYQSADEAIEEIKRDRSFNLLQEEEEVPEGDPDVQLAELADRAENSIKAQDTAVSMFSQKESFLAYLLELATLDREQLGLVLDRIRITPEKMELSGKVRDYPEARQLRETIREWPFYGSLLPPEALEQPTFKLIQIIFSHARKQEE